MTLGKFATLLGLALFLLGATSCGVGCYRMTASGVEGGLGWATFGFFVIVPALVILGIRGFMAFISGADSDAVGAMAARRGGGRRGRSGRRG